jgi:hypothetical protein
MTVAADGTLAFDVGGGRGLARPAGRSPAARWCCARSVDVRTGSIRS